MADYECYPIWDVGAATANADPASLDIPLDLATALSAWGDEYTATLNRSDPAASGFTDERVAETWLAAGAELAARLRTQGFQVVYFHDGMAPRDLVAAG